HVAREEDVEDLPRAVRQASIARCPALEQRVDRSADFAFADDRRLGGQADMVGFHRRDEIQLAAGERTEQRLRTKLAFRAGNEHAFRQRHFSSLECRCADWRIATTYSGANNDSVTTQVPQTITRQHNSNICYGNYVFGSMDTLLFARAAGKIDPLLGTCRGLAR